jgi:hypothetical protein
MSAEKLYSEVFEDFDKCSTKAERLAILQKYGHKNFQEFLIAAFNPNVIFDVEIPDYRPAQEPAGLNFTYLSSEVPKLYRFVKDHPARSPNLSAEKKKSLLVVILESLHKDEAELLIKAIKKDLNVKYLTANLVREAFPGINL